MEDTTKNNVIAELLNRKRLSMTDLIGSPAWDELRKISSEIDSRMPWQILYHAVNCTPVPICICGKKLPWHPDKRKYRTYCSPSCTSTGTAVLRKKKNLDTIGVEWHSQLSGWKEKVKESSIAKYGVDHYSKTSEFTSRVIATNQEKFGVDYPSQSPTVQQQVTTAWVEKYGVSNPAKLDSIKSKTAATNFTSYGVANPAQLHYSAEALLVLNDPIEFTNLCATMPVRAIAKELNISTNPLYRKVKELGIILPRFNQSQLEQEISEFIKSIYSGNLLLNDYSILKTKQLDIVLLDQQIAIECNGSYWHSELNGRDSKYHLNKSAACQLAGIRLIHVWEHDWYQKQEIIKSKIKSVIQQNTKIYARKCSIKEITPSVAKVFLNENHLQGHCNSATVAIGLFHNQCLVATMTLGKNRFGKTAQWELLRFANKINYNIVGGASKLFTYFTRAYLPTSVISYCDLAMNTGAVYQKIGFRFTHNSRPNYRYTVDYQHFASRNKFQKKKLSKLLSEFDNTLSEWENMKQNGWDRIWDCGNAVYEWTNNG